MKIRVLFCWRKEAKKKLLANKNITGISRDIGNENDIKDVLERDFKRFGEYEKGLNEGEGGEIAMVVDNDDVHNVTDVETVNENFEEFIDLSSGVFGKYSSTI